jgi:integrase
MAHAQRSGGGWRARWVLADGVHYKSRSGFHRKRDAELYGARQESLTHGARWFDPHGGRLTLDAWWARWFPAQDLAPATLEGYAQQYRKYIGPRWGSALLGSISPLEVAAFEKELHTHLSSSSVTVVMSVLRGLLDAAVAEQLIVVSPVRAHRRRRPAPDEGRQGVVVDVRTVERIRSRLDCDEALLVLVAEFTGMRWGEVCGMRRSLLDLCPAKGRRSASGVYHINARVGAVHEDVHGGRYYGPPKSRRSRAVDLPPLLVELLLAHVRTMGERDLLFPDATGQPRRHDGWNRRSWRPACDGGAVHPRGRAAAPVCTGLRFHDLRHCHKAMMNSLRVPDAMQNDRLGHRPPGMGRIYDHPTPRMRSELVAALQRLWTDSRGRRGT